MEDAKMDFYDIERMYEGASGGFTVDEIHSKIREMGTDAVDERSLNTVLHLAAKYADTELIKELIDGGFDVGAKNSYGENALFALADCSERRNISSEDKRKAADMLLDAGCSVMQRSEGDGETCITKAAMLGVCPELIESAAEMGKKVSRTNENGQSALWLACDYDDTEGGQDDRSRKRHMNYVRTVKALVGAGVEDEPYDGETAAQRAVNNGVKDLAAIIAGEYEEDGGFEAGAGISIFEAVKTKDYEAISAIASSSCDLNALAEDGDEPAGCTPLAAAVFYMDLKAAELLLSNGADVNARNADGESCIMSAVKKFAFEGYAYEERPDSEKTILKQMLNLLEKAGFDKDAVCCDNGDTPIIAAARRADKSGTLCYDMVKALISMKANLNAASNDGETALMLVCRQEGYRMSDLCAALMEAGADYKMADREGRSALHYAVMCAHDESAKEMAQTLFDYDFDAAELVSNDKKTALELAIDKEFEATAKLILANT